jgi:hypothetical protein
MKSRKRSFAVISLLFPVLLSLSIETAYAGDSASLVLAAARSAKQQCISACRARYRDCRHLNQLPSSECRAIYQDCTQYSCTGLGPG